jgi:molybdenum cofactor biosynthesis protein MoaC
MVLDHDLDSDAAKRMGARWEEVFAWKGVSEDVRQADEENLDWEEFDAGLGWLRDEADRSPGEELGKETMREKRNYLLPEDFSSSYRSQENGGARSTELQSKRLHTLAPTSRRYYSTSTQPSIDLDQEFVAKDTATRSSNELKAATPEAPSLPHLTSSGTAHMVSVGSKPHTLRTAIAVGTVYFSNPTPLSLIRSNSLKKGDVLSVSRIAGIMAAKKCPDLVPLCHPIMLTHVGVELSVFGSEEGESGGVTVEAKVQCEGQTGVEMEALTAVMGATLSVVDMCKAVDKGMRVDGVRVVLKEGGRSGVWREEGWRSGNGKK